MSIRTTCPNPDCVEAFDVPNEAVGRTAKCNKCNTRFVIHIGAGKLIDFKPSSDFTVEPSTVQPPVPPAVEPPFPLFNTMSGQSSRSSQESGKSAANLNCRTAPQANRSRLSRRSKLVAITVLSTLFLVVALLLVASGKREKGLVSQTRQRQTSEKEVPKIDALRKSIEQSIITGTGASHEPTTPAIEDTAVGADDDRQGRTVADSGLAPLRAKLPSDFAFTFLTMFRDTDDILSPLRGKQLNVRIIGSHGDMDSEIEEAEVLIFSAVSMGRNEPITVRIISNRGRITKECEEAEVRIQCGRDTVTGLRGRGLTVKRRILGWALGKDRTSAVSIAVYDTELLWEPEACVFFRDGKALAVWQPETQELGHASAETTSRDADDAKAPVVAIWHPAVKRNKTFAGLSKVPDDITQLVGKLRGTNGEAKIDACQRLERLGPRAEVAIPLLVKTLNDSAAYGVSIGNFPAMRASLSPASCAAHALAAIGRPAETAVPALSSLLQNGSDYERVAAAMALVRIDSAAAISNLDTALLDKGLSSYVRCFFLSRRAELAADPAPYVEKLATFLSAESSDAQRQACYSLTKIGPAARAAVPQLVRLLQRINIIGDQMDDALLYDLGAEVVRSLGEIGDPSCFEPVVEFLKVRESTRFLEGVGEALVALGRLEDDRAVPILTATLKKAGPGSPIATAAIRGLGYIGPLARDTIGLLCEHKEQLESSPRSSKGALAEVNNTILKVRHDGRNPFE